MTRLLHHRSLWRFLLLFAAICSGQNSNGQSAGLRDSLRQLLVRLGEKTNDENVKGEAGTVLAMYTGTVTDTVAGKLLAIETLTFNSLELSQPLLLAYGEAVMKTLAFLLPQGLNRYYLKSVSGLGFLNEQIGAYEKALSLYGQALSIAEKAFGERSPGYAENLNSLASVHERTGEYEKALALGEKGLAIRKQLAEEKQQSDTASLLAYAASLTTVSVILYLDMDECRRALPLVEEALSIRKKLLGEENADYAENLNTLAGIYESTGHYKKALALYQRELAIMKNVLGENHPDYAYTLNDMAYLYEDMGEYDKALHLYTEALLLRKKTLGSQHIHYATALNNLSALYWKLGDVDKAIKMAEEGLAVKKSALGDDNSDYAISLNNLARMLTDAGQYAKAMDFSDQAIAIRKKYGQRDHYYVQCLNTKARLFQQAGNDSQALAAFTEAKNIMDELAGKDTPDYGTCLQNIGNLYRSMEDYAAALPLLEESLQIFENALGKEHPDYTAGLNAKASLLQNLNRNGEASALLIEASGSTLRNLERTYSSLSEQEKMSYANKELFRFAYLPSFSFGNKQTIPRALQQLYANELTLKGMVLEDQKQVLRGIRSSNDSLLLSVFDQWQANKRFLGKQALLPLRQRIAYFDSLQDATNRLEQALSRLSNAFRQQQKDRNISVKDVSQKLRKNEAALEFIRFPYYNKKWTDSVFYAALLLLPGDSVPRFIPLCEERHLKRLLAIPRNKEAVIAVQELYRPEGDKRHADWVYRLVWEPLEPYLKGVHTVYFAPAGLLHRVCFNALRNQMSRSLIARYDLHQLLSTRTVALPASSAPKLSSAGLWGGVDYNRPKEAIALRRNADASGAALNPVSAFDLYTSDVRGLRGSEFSALPNTKKEVTTIRQTLRLYGVRTALLSDTLASEEAFKALDGQSPQVLHLATHGFFLPMTERKSNNYEGGSAFTVQQNPMFRSGLVLAGGNAAWRGEPTVEGREDGILTAYEIAQLDLSTAGLVVLSACQTAVGDVQANEGVIGLQRAFKLAGVKQLIESLWSVPDKETKELMTLFYRNWLNGQTTRAALRNAQLKMKEKYPPFYWAAFVLIE